MKVLHVFKDYYPPTRGGVEQHIHDVVHSLDGFDFAVLTSSRSRRTVIDRDGPVRVLRAAEFARPASTPITPAWRGLIKHSGSDLLHFHSPNPFGEMMMLVARTWTPSVVTFHADIVRRSAAFTLFRPFQQRFLGKASRIVVSSPKLLETSSALQAHRDRAVVIPFGVDPDLWRRRPPAADELRERYGTPLIVYLGRLAWYKGVDILISAMRGVDATALVIGDGPRKQRLQGEAVKARVGRKVVFVGEVPDEDRASYYHAADVFVLPATARAEAFGIAAMEAMACGTPVITTELGTGTSWLNLDRKTGLVVAPGDPAALAGAIKALLVDDARRRDIGEAAAERVLTQFTKRAMLESLESLYRSL